MTPPTTTRLAPLVNWVDAQGELRSAAMDASFAATQRPESFEPVRKIKNHRNQSHKPGLYYCAKLNSHITYESRLEASWLMMLDFDPTVKALSAQPFEIVSVEAGRTWKRIPDIFVRHVDGHGAVYDVKPLEFTTDPDIQQGFERARNACESVGYEYVVATEPDPMRWAAISWLGGYRRQPQFFDMYAEEICAVAAEPISINELLGHFGAPELVLPILFHLCWRHDLGIEMDKPLREETLVGSVAS